MDLNVFGYSLGVLPAWVPPWAIPAAIVHLAMFAVLLIPAWVALARARAFGVLSLLLILPVIGLIAICARVMSSVLPYAGWSRAWGLLVLIPGLNIFFLWLFAFAPWRRRYVPLAEDDEEEAADEKPSVRQAPAGMSQEPAPSAMPEAATSERPAPQTTGEPLSPATMLAGSATPAKPEPAAEPTIMPSMPAPAAKGPRTIDVAKEPAKAPRDEPAPARAAPPAAGGGRNWRIVGANDIAAGIDLALAEASLRDAENGVLVGRSSRAHIIIEHDSVSRNHARFALVNGVLYVEDLDSMNGSWLEGRKLEANKPTPVRPGNVVEFGKVKLRISAG